MTHSDYIHRLISEGEHVHQDFSQKHLRLCQHRRRTPVSGCKRQWQDSGRALGRRNLHDRSRCPALLPTSRRNPYLYIYKVEGKDVLEVVIDENPHKPIYALDAQEQKWAYIRIKDENILANPIHLNIWRHNRTEEKIVVAYTPREQQVLTLLGQHESLTLNQCQRLARMNRKQITSLLADFIRFGLVEQVFREHAFYFRLKEHID